MASQPANSSISVYRTVRAYRQSHRHDAVASLTKKLRPLVLSVPGEEDHVEVKTRNTSLSDFSSYMGQAAAGASRGMPIVIGTRSAPTFEAAQEGITGVAAAITVGGDQFLENSAGSLSGDLHQGARDLS